MIRHRSQFKHSRIGVCTRFTQKKTKKKKKKKLKTEEVNSKSNRIKEIKISQAIISKIKAENRNRQTVFGGMKTNFN